MIPDQIRKLMIYALDEQASVGEAENAWAMALRKFRQDPAALAAFRNSLMGSDAPTPPPVYRPPETRHPVREEEPELVFPTGKFKGRSVAEVYELNPNYVRLMSQSASAGHATFYKKLRSWLDAHEAF